MKNLLKKLKSELDLSSVAELLTAGAAAGMAISSYAGKKGKNSAVIAAGLSLLIGGLFLATDDSQSREN